MDVDVLRPILGHPTTFPTQSVFQCFHECLEQGGATINWSGPKLQPIFSIGATKLGTTPCTLRPAPTGTVRRVFSNAPCCKPATNKTRRSNGRLRRWSRDSRTVAPPMNNGLQVNVNTAFLHLDAAGSWTFLRTSHLIFASFCRGK